MMQREAIQEIESGFGYVNNHFIRDTVTELAIESDGYDFEKIRVFEDLKILRISTVNLESLKGISHVELEEIELSKCTVFDWDEINNSSSLQKLSIHECQFECLLRLRDPMASSLRSLVLGYPIEVSGELIEDISRCKSLEALSFLLPDDISEVELDKLKTLSNLRELDLSTTGSLKLGFLKELVGLEKLYMEGVVGNAYLENCQCLSNLKSLTIDGVDLDTNFNLSKFVNLETLYISRGTEYNDEIMNNWSDIEKLRDKDELIRALGQAILMNNETVGNTRWDVVSILGSYEQDGLHLYGYLYEGDRKIADVAFNRNTVGLIFNKLRNVMSAEFKHEWQAGVFNIREPELKLTSAFEYDDETRWLPSSGKEQGTQAHAETLLLK